MANPFISLSVGVSLRAKWQGVGLHFGSLIDDRSNLAWDGCSISVGFDEVLLNFRSNHFKEVAKHTDYWEVSKDGFFLLKHIVNANCKNRN